MIISFIHRSTIQKLIHAVYEKREIAYARQEEEGEDALIGAIIFRLKDPTSRWNKVKYCGASFPFDLSFYGLGLFKKNYNN